MVAQPRSFSHTLPRRLLCHTSRSGSALIALCAGIVLPSPALAQGPQPVPGVRIIPVTSKQLFMKLSPDGKTVAVAEDSLIWADEPRPEYLPIHVFDVESGGEIATLTGFTDYASDLAFTPDGARLASYHANGWIYLWDVKSGRQMKAIPAMPLPHRIKFLPDGRTLLTLQGGTTTVWLWNTVSGSVTHIYGPRPASQKDLKARYLGSPPNWLVFADVSPDGKTLVTMTILGEISLWDVKNGAETPVGERMPPEAKQMLQKASPFFSPDGTLLLYSDFADRAIHVIDLATRRETASVPVGVVGSRKFFDLAPDGDTLAWVENTDSKVTVHAWSLSRNASVGDVPVSTGTDKGLPVLAFTPDGRRVVIGGFAAMDNHNAVYVADVTR